MKHAVTKPRPPFLTADGKLEIHQIPVWQDNLVWLIRAPGHPEAAVVDGPEAGPVLEYCEANGLKLTTVLNTHTHFDHIGINNELQERGALASMRVVGPKKVASSVPGINEPVVDHQEVELFGTTGLALLTEGHIDGHISYVFDDVLFCGDTLFAAGCGYLFDGPPAKMHASLKKLAGLPQQTRVCCAHEYTQDNLRFAWSLEPDNPALAARIDSVWALRARGECSVPSTLSEELKTNPFLRFDSPGLKARLAQAMPGVDLSTPEQIFAATRGLKDRKDYRSIDDEALLSR